MRTGMGGWVVAAIVAGLLSAAGADLAVACKGCGADMFCAEVPMGAYFCIGSGDACAMAGRCRSESPGGYVDDFAMVQLTLLDDAAGMTRLGAARIVRGAGQAAVGRQAARLARATAGPAAAEPAIAFSGVGAGEGVTVAFRSRRGDGFTFRRDADGRGARVAVRALVNGRPGPVLARERLGEQDALLVRVTLDGRPRVLVVMAPTLPGTEAEPREREARLALRGENGAWPGARELPFELEPVAE
jgi:hypothetical protein